MKKFLFITKNFTPEIGGGIRRIQSIYEILSINKNIKLDVVVGVKQNNKNKNVKYIKQLFFKDKKNIKKIEFINTKSKIKLFDKALIGWVPNVLLNILFKEYDFVFVSCPSFSNVIAGFFYKLLRLCKPKLIIEYRDFFSFNPSFINNLNKKIYKIIESFIIRISDYIIVTTTSMKTILSKIKNPDKIIVIKNYIGKNDIDIIKKFKKINMNKKYNNFGYIGRLNTGRNPQDILHLLNIKINNKKNTLHFIGINDAEKEWVLKTCEKLNFDKSRLFLKNEVDRLTSLKLMKSFDALIIIVNNKSLIKDGYGIPGKIYDYIAVNNNIISDEETFNNLKSEFKFKVKKKFKNFINYNIKDNQFLDDVFNKTINDIIK